MPMVIDIIRDGMATGQGDRWGMVDDPEGLRIALPCFGITIAKGPVADDHATDNIPSIPDVLDLDALLGG